MRKKTEEMFLSCPPELESLATPLVFMDKGSELGVRRCAYVTEDFNIYGR